jgi:hypothetical protein
MKGLSDYMAAAQTALFEKLGVFFAFSPQQFQEARKDGVKYVTLGHGLVCPKEHAEQVAEGVEQIHVQAVAQRMQDYTKTEIIEYELGNYECYYTGDWGDALDALQVYGYTGEDVRAVYYATNEQH